MKQILQKIVCWFAGHNWTSAAKEGKRPSLDQIARDYAGFQDYAKMYCKRCSYTPKQ